MANGEEGIVLEGGIITRHMDLKVPIETPPMDTSKMKKKKKERKFETEREKEERKRVKEEKKQVF